MDPRRPARGARRPQTAAGRRFGANRLHSPGSVGVHAFRRLRSAGHGTARVASGPADNPRSGSVERFSRYETVLLLARVLDLKGGDCGVILHWYERNPQFALSVRTEPAVTEDQRLVGPD